MTVDAPTPTRLADEGRLELSTGAVRAYADYSRLPYAQAECELWALIPEARPVDVHARPEKWRYRNRAKRVDISARVERDGGTLTVVAITVRHYQRPSGGAQVREGLGPEITLRLPRELHDRVRARAQDAGISIAEWIRDACMVEACDEGEIAAQLMRKRRTPAKGEL